MERSGEVLMVRTMFMCLTPIYMLRGSVQVEQWED